MLVAATIRNRPHECWVTRLIYKYHNEGILVRILDVRNDRQAKAVRQLFEIIATPELVKEVAKELRNETSLSDVKLVVSNAGRIYGSARVAHPLPCSLPEAFGCFLRAVTTNVGGEVEWHVVGKPSAYRCLIQRLEEMGIEAGVHRLQRLRGDRALTGRQEVAVKTALDLGYFDCPKKISIEELAKVLGITPATLTEMLRKGIKKILSDYFGQRGTLHIALNTTRKAKPAYSRRRNNWDETEGYLQPSL